MIEKIFITQKHNGALLAKDQVDVVAGLGIVGDRYFDKKTHPGQNISFIEIESIEAFNEYYRCDMPLTIPRRNIFTRGVQLNDLVGETFMFGSVEFLGVELCDPCADFGADLVHACEQNVSVAAFDAAEAVKFLVNKSGLRADVVNDGCLSVGLPFGKN